jgi:hypothetical protein
MLFSGTFTGVEPGISQVLGRTNNVATWYFAPGSSIVADIGRHQVQGLGLLGVAGFARRRTVQA